MFEKELVLYQDEIEEGDENHIDVLTELKIISFEKDHWIMNDEIKHLVNLNRTYKKKIKKTQEQRDRENKEDILYNPNEGSSDEVCCNSCIHPIEPDRCCIPFTNLNNTSATDSFPFFI